ncbi:MAG TPA: MBOAT family O-acyltransferase [Actinomycetota bacterium]|nr:MBOAT family O-acyltransferase [Actinomycetota bacterium]
MLFPTTDFALFFAIVFALHWVLNRYRTPWKWFILAASYVFYGWWDPGLVWLLVLVSTLAWGAAAWVERQQDDVRRRRRTLVAVGALLLPLAWFKYYGFFALNVANAFESVGLEPPLPLLQVLLPIGISFYTFMAISYVVDVSRYEIQPSGWLDVSVYLAFFPHLIAGPIVRGKDLIPQIRRRRDAGAIDLSRAAFLILGGLFKKVVISSYLATQIVDPVFGAPSAHGGLEVLIAIYAYAIVIYADFSAYTDIAIGTALLLGFEFPANFDRPYTAISIQDFWRRWHMTLSSWLRDYLYVPLGGSRHGELRTAVNLMVTMILGGLWHGAGWTFLAWGAYNGAALVIGRRRRMRARAQGIAQATAGWALARQRIVTFHLVCLGWVFFRSDSMGSAFELLGRLFAPGSLEVVTPLVLIAIVGMLVVQYLPSEPALRVRVVFSRLAPVLQGAALALVLFAITTLGPQGVTPFIYFRF